MIHVHQASWSNVHPVHLLHLRQAYAFLEPTDATDAVRIVEPVPVFAAYVLLVVSEPVFRERLVFWFSRPRGIYLADIFNGGHGGADCVPRHFCLLRFSLWAPK